METTIQKGRKQMKCGSCIISNTQMHLLTKEDIFSEMMEVFNVNIYVVRCFSLSSQRALASNKFLDSGSYVW